MSDNVKYLLGIDGGGTKTEFLLTDLNKNEIKRIILGTSNPVNAGIENTFSVLRQGIERICENLNKCEISVFAGIAGGGSENIKDSIREFLKTFGFGKFSNGSDTDNAISTALKGENGTAVIMGTGIVAFGVLEGKAHRAGGWGYMLDKGGSAFCYGSDALNCAYEYLDGRGESEMLLKLAEEKMNMPLKEAVSRIYDGGPVFVASFAPVVFEAYKNGDKTAESIIDRNSYEAAKVIAAACGKSAQKRENVVILGGLCKQREILLPFISKYLGEGYAVDFSDEPAVNGAVALAKSNVTE